jgi:hypothetical protein
MIHIYAYIYIYIYIYMRVSTVEQAGGGWGAVSCDIRGAVVAGASHPSKFTLYFPRLADDAYSMLQDGDANCKDTEAGCFYGVCVEQCPRKGDLICNYEVEAQIATEFAGESEREAARRARANKHNGCWRVQMQQMELFKRCLV